MIPREYKPENLDAIIIPPNKEEIFVKDEEDLTRQASLIVATFFIIMNAIPTALALGELSKINGLGFTYNPENIRAPFPELILLIHIIPSLIAAIGLIIHLQNRISQGKLDRNNDGYFTV